MSDRIRSSENTIFLRFAHINITLQLSELQRVHTLTHIFRIFNIGIFTLASWLLALAMTVDSAIHSTHMTHRQCHHYEHRFCRKFLPSCTKELPSKPRCENATFLGTSFYLPQLEPQRSILCCGKPAGAQLLPTCSMHDKTKQRKIKRKQRESSAIER